MSYSWTYPGTTRRENLLDHTRDSLPRLLRSDGRAEEIERAHAAVIGTAGAIVDDWTRSTYVGNANGIWLDARGSDTSARRQDDEVDADYRERLRSPPDSVSPAAIEAGVQALVDAAGVSGDAAFVELRKAKAFFGDFTSEVNSDGGDFTNVEGDTWEFTPDTQFASKVVLGRWRVTFASASEGGNNGTFVIDAWNGNAIQFENASGVEELDSSATATIVKYDADGNDLDGHSKAFFSRGHRMGSSRTPNSAVVILPYGTSEGLRQSVADWLRMNKAFGVRIVVERRVTAP